MHQNLQNPQVEEGIKVTAGEVLMLAKVPMEHKVRELGAIRATEKIRDRALRAKMSRKFSEGYDFCMAMHKFPEIQENDQPKETFEKREVSEGGIIL